MNACRSPFVFFICLHLCVVLLHYPVTVFMAKHRTLFLAIDAQAGVLAASLVGEHVVPRLLFLELANILLCGKGRQDYTTLDSLH